jgi:diguanylate cyclase (GGDEF)-like protein
MSSLSILMRLTVQQSEKRKTRLVVIISLLMVLGFSSTSLVSYLVANNSLNNYIRVNTLPLTSDNIYSEIQRDVLPTVIISSVMAQDTFVRDWIKSGEKNTEQIIQYLSSIQQRYSTATAFFISDKTHNYYHPHGLVRQISEEDPRDKWYFRVEKLKEDFEINVDIDLADTAQPTNFFVNHKVQDDNGHFLGVIGVGLSSTMVRMLIDFYQEEYNRQVYFVQPNGNITLSAEVLPTDSHINIKNLPGIGPIAEQLLSEEKGSYTYLRDDEQVFLNSRYVPELDWYLLVEEVGKPASLIKQTLWINLFLSLLITIIVLFMTQLTLRRYQSRLVTMATKDKLTGLDNRHAFEASYRQNINVAIRNNEPLSMILIDIDHFKNINDQHGHMAGDSVLTQFAHLLNDTLRASDSLCRWGGEEFIMLLPQCNQHDAGAIAEQLRKKINAHQFEVDDKKIGISASFGVSQYILAETEDALISRVDSALYKAKSAGRNCVKQISGQLKG